MRISADGIVTGVPRSSFVNLLPPPSPPPPPPPAAEVGAAYAILHQNLTGKVINDQTMQSAVNAALAFKTLDQQSIYQAALLIKVQSDAQNTAANKQMVTVKTNADPFTQAKIELSQMKRADKLPLFDSDTLTNAANAMKNGTVATAPGQAMSSYKPFLGVCATGQPDPVWPTLPAGQANPTVKQVLAQIETYEQDGLSPQAAIAAARVQYGGSDDNEGTLAQAALANQAPAQFDAYQKNFGAYQDKLANDPQSKVPAPLDPVQLAAQELAPEFSPATLNKVLYDNKTGMVKALPTTKLDGTAAQAAATQLAKDQAANASPTQIAADMAAYRAAVVPELDAATGETGTDWMNEPTEIDAWLKGQMAVTNANLQPLADAAYGKKAGSAEQAALTAAETNLGQAFDDAQIIADVTNTHAPPQAGDTPAAAAQNDLVAQNQRLTGDLQGLGFNTSTSIQNNPNDPNAQARYDDIIDDPAIQQLKTGATNAVIDAAGPTANESTAASENDLKQASAHLSEFQGTVFYPSILSATEASGAVRARFEDLGSVKPGDGPGVLDEITATLQASTPEVAGMAVDPDLTDALYEQMYKKHVEASVAKDQWYIPTSAFDWSTNQAPRYYADVSNLYVALGRNTPDAASLADVVATRMDGKDFVGVTYYGSLTKNGPQENIKNFYLPSIDGKNGDIQGNYQLFQDIADTTDNPDTARFINAELPGQMGTPPAITSDGPLPYSGPGDTELPNGPVTITSRIDLINLLGKLHKLTPAANAPADGQQYDGNSIVYGGTTLNDLANATLASQNLTDVSALDPLLLSFVSAALWRPDQDPLDDKDPKNKPQDVWLIQTDGSAGQRYLGSAGAPAQSSYQDWLKHTGFAPGTLYSEQSSIIGVDGLERNWGDMTAITAPTAPESWEHKLEHVGGEVASLGSIAVITFVAPEADGLLLPLLYDAAQADFAVTSALDVDRRMDDIIRDPSSWGTWTTNGFGILTDSFVDASALGHFGLTRMPALLGRGLEVEALGKSGTVMLDRTVGGRVLAKVTGNGLGAKTYKVLDTAPAWVVTARHLAETGAAITSGIQMAVQGFQLGNAMWHGQPVSLNMVAQFLAPIGMGKFGHLLGLDHITSLRGNKLLDPNAANPFEPSGTYRADLLDAHTGAPFSAPADLGPAALVLTGGWSATAITPIALPADHASLGDETDDDHTNAPAPDPVVSYRLLGLIDPNPEELPETGDAQVFSFPEKFTPPTDPAPPQSAPISTALPLAVGAEHDPVSSPVVGRPKLTLVPSLPDVMLADVAQTILNSVGDGTPDDRDHKHDAEKPPRASAPPKLSEATASGTVAAEAPPSTAVVEGVAQPEPVGLYVSRQVDPASAELILGLAREALGPDAHLVPPEQMHVTVVRSRTDLRPGEEFVPQTEPLTIIPAPDATWQIIRLGTGAVLRFEEPSLEARFLEAQGQGAASDYPGPYLVHITLSYDIAEFEPKTASAFPITLEAETAVPYNSNWVAEQGLDRRSGAAASTSGTDAPSAQATRAGAEPPSPPDLAALPRLTRPKAVHGERDQLLLSSLPVVEDPAGLLYLPRGQMAKDQASSQPLDSANKSAELPPARPFREPLPSSPEETGPFQTGYPPKKSEYPLQEWMAEYVPETGLFYTEARKVDVQWVVRPHHERRDTTNIVMIRPDVHVVSALATTDSLFDLGGRPVTTLLDKRRRLITPQRLVNRLSERFGLDERSYTPGQPIALLAEHTAAGGRDSFAQQLANEVHAPVYGLLGSYEERQWALFFPDAVSHPTMQPDFEAPRHPGQDGQAVRAKWNLLEKRETTELEVLAPGNPVKIDTFLAPQGTFAINAQIEELVRRGPESVAEAARTAGHTADQTTLLLTLDASEQTHQFAQGLADELGGPVLIMTDQAWRDGGRAVTKNTVTVSRVEGAENQRISIDSEGRVTFLETAENQKSAIWLNFGPIERSQDYFERKDGQITDARLITFEVPRSELESIRRKAVRQSDATKPGNSRKPLLGDWLASPDQFGVRWNSAKRLENLIIPGSARIVSFSEETGSSEVAAQIHPKRDELGRAVTITSPTQASDPSNWADATQTAVFVPLGACPDTLNGVAMAAWEAPTTLEGWEGIANQNPPLSEPIPHPGIKKAGAVIVEPDGRVWIIQSTNDFAGARTFPKGGVEDGLSLQATAIKEAYEETGLQIELLGHLTDIKPKSSKTTTRYYIARRIGGTPSEMGWETQGAYLVPKNRVPETLRTARDKTVFAALERSEGSGVQPETPQVSDTAAASFDPTGAGAAVVRPTDLQLVPRTDMPMRKALKEFVAPEGYFRISARGLHNSTVLGLTGDENTPTELAQQIRENPAYQGQPIVLMSDFAGRGDTSFAQHLANEMDVEVFAPQEALAFDDQGKVAFESAPRRFVPTSETIEPHDAGGRYSGLPPLSELQKANVSHIYNVLHDLVGEYLPATLSLSSLLENIHFLPDDAFNRLRQDRSIGNNLIFGFHVPKEEGGPKIILRESVNTTKNFHQLVRQAWELPPDTPILGNLTPEDIIGHEIVHYISSPDFIKLSRELDQTFSDLGWKTLPNIKEGLAEWMSWGQFGNRPPVRAEDTMMNALPSRAEYFYQAALDSYKAELDGHSDQIGSGDGEFKNLLAAYPDSVTFMEMLVREAGWQTIGRAAVRGDPAALDRVRTLALGPVADIYAEHVGDNNAKHAETGQTGQSAEYVEADEREGGTALNDIFHKRSTGNEALPQKVPDWGTIDLSQEINNRPSRPTDLALRKDYPTEFRALGYSPPVQASEALFVVDSHFGLNPDGSVQPLLPTHQGYLNADAVADLIKAHPNWRDDKVVLLLGCRLAESTFPQSLADSLGAPVAASHVSVTTGVINGRIRNLISARSLLTRNAHLEQFELFSPREQGQSFPEGPGRAAQGEMEYEPPTSGVSAARSAGETASDVASAGPDAPSDFSFVPIEDLEVSGYADARGFLPTYSHRDGAAVSMVLASHLGYPIAEAARITTAQGEQVKPAGTDAFVVMSQDSGAETPYQSLVQANAKTGLPVGYAAVQPGTGALAIGMIDHKLLFPGGGGSSQHVPASVPSGPGKVRASIGNEATPLLVTSLDELVSAAGNDRLDKRTNIYVYQEDKPGWVPGKPTFKAEATIAANGDIMVAQGKGKGGAVSLSDYVAANKLGTDARFVVFSGGHKLSRAFGTLDRHEPAPRPAGVDVTAALMSGALKPVEDKPGGRWPGGVVRDAEGALGPKGRLYMLKWFGDPILQPGANTGEYAARNTVATSLIYRAWLGPGAVAEMRLATWTDPNTGSVRYGVATPVAKANFASDAAGEVLTDADRSRSNGVFAAAAAHVALQNVDPVGTVHSNIGIVTHAGVPGFREKTAFHVDLDSALGVDAVGNRGPFPTVDFGAPYNSAATDQPITFDRLTKDTGSSGATPAGGVPADEGTAAIFGAMTTEDYCASIDFSRTQVDAGLLNQIKQIITEHGGGPQPDREALANQVVDTVERQIAWRDSVHSTIPVEPAVMPKATSVDAKPRSGRTHAALSRDYVRSKRGTDPRTRGHRLVNRVFIGSVRSYFAAFAKVGLHRDRLIANPSPDVGSLTPTPTSTPAGPIKLKGRQKIGVAMKTAIFTGVGIAGYLAYDHVTKITKYQKNAKVSSLLRYVLAAPKLSKQLQDRALDAVSGGHLDDVSDIVNSHYRALDRHLRSLKVDDAKRKAIKEGAETLLGRIQWAKSGYEPDEIPALLEKYFAKATEISGIPVTNADWFSPTRTRGVAARSAIIASWGVGLAATARSLSLHVTLHMLPALANSIGFVSVIGLTAISTALGRVKDPKYKPSGKLKTLIKGLNSTGNVAFILGYATDAVATMSKISNLSVLTKVVGSPLSIAADVGLAYLNLKLSRLQQPSKKIAVYRDDKLVGYASPTKEGLDWHKANHDPANGTVAFDPATAQAADYLQDPNGDVRPADRLVPTRKTEPAAMRNPVAVKATGAKQALHLGGTAGGNLDRINSWIGKQGKKSNPTTILLVAGGIAVVNLFNYLNGVLTAAPATPPATSDKKKPKSSLPPTQPKPPKGVSPPPPPKPATPPPFHVVTAEKDDTLWGIAEDDKVNLAELMPLNPQFDWSLLDGNPFTARKPGDGRDPDLLYAGDRVKVPGPGQPQQP